MKICYVVPWFPSENIKTQESQQGIFEYRNILGLSERGNEFRIITIKWGDQLEHEIINENIEVFRVPYYFHIVRYPLPHFLKLRNKIKQIIETWNPDLIVYSHMIYLTSLPLFSSINNEKPVIVTTDCIPGINWFFGNKIVDFIGYIYSVTFGKKILRKADGIHLLSSCNLDYLLKWGINPKKIFIVPRGVNTQKFSPRKGSNDLKTELGIKSNEIVILFVGRLDLVKGAEYFIDAAKQLLKRYDNLKFLLVGGGALSEKYIMNSKDYVDKINFLGFRTDIPDLMNISDIFVLTSLSEGACNVVLEASSSGVPVIATKVGEVPEIIINDSTGLIINPKDVENLVKSIEKLIKNPLLAKSFGNEGRKRIEKFYDENIIYDKTMEYYNSIVDLKKSKLGDFNE